MKAFLNQWSTRAIWMYGRMDVPVLSSVNEGVDVFNSSNSTLVFRPAGGIRRRVWSLTSEQRPRARHQLSNAVPVPEDQFARPNGAQHEHRREGQPGPPSSGKELSPLSRGDGRGRVEQEDWYQRKVVTAMPEDDRVYTT